MVVAVDSLAGAVGAEDVSVEACPAGDEPVGTAVSPFTKTLKRAARITAKVMPAKNGRQRGSFILRRSPRQSELHCAFPKLALARIGVSTRSSSQNST
jgi:hypothetical protein